MRTTQFLAILLTGFAGAVMASCSKEEKETPVVENEVTFTVGVGQVSMDSADLIVRHDGKNSAQWYGFLTEDIQSDEESLIQAQLSNVSKSTIHVGTSQTIALTGLNDGSIYKYIAFGVNVDKERYGKPASVTFTTSPDYNVTFKVEAGEVTTSSAAFTITHDGKEHFTWYGFATDDLASDVKELAQKAYNDLLTDGAVTDASVLLSGTSKTVTVEGLAFDKEYRYIAFGVDQIDGKALYFGTPGEAAARTAVDYDAITFSVEPVSVRKNGATFKVSYNTASDLTWYAFNTDDLTTSTADLVKAKVAGITAADYQSGNAVETSIEGLQPLTGYRFIVTGIKDGAAYGTPADFSYTSADEDYDAITFSAEVVEAGLTSAKVKVSHDGGDDKFQWIAVVSTDLTSAAADILPKPEEVAADAVKSGQEVEVEIEGLEEKTEYRYIISGYREDASGNKYLYGTPADITFKTDSFWKVNPDWTVTFEGKTDDYAGYPYKFTNTVASGSTSGKYFFALYDQDEVDKYDDLEDLIAANIEDEVDYLKYLVENNPSRYPDLASLLYDGSSNIWYKLSFKTYYVFAIGLTDEGEATGKYAYAKYTNEPSSEDKAAYEKWLGQWMVPCDDHSDLWVISAKEDCVSYDILGFQGGLFDDYGALEGIFDATTGHLRIYTQSLETPFSSSSYGEITLWVLGQLASGSFYSGNYMLADIEMSADGQSANMAAGTINTSSGTQPVAAFQYRGLINAGDYAGRYLYWNQGKSKTPVPNTMTRPGDGSDEYKKWLGEWDVVGRNRADTADSTYFQVNIAANTGDVDYIMTGWEGYDYDFLALYPKFNGTDGSVSFYAGSSTPVAENVNISNEANNIYFFGFIEYNNGYSRITSGSTSGYEAAKAVLTDDNNASVTGQSITLTDGNSYPIVFMSYLRTPDQSNYYYIGDAPNFPVKFKRAGGSGAPAKIFGNSHQNFHSGARQQGAFSSAMAVSAASGSVSTPMMKKYQKR